jgi:hypothetical protein
MITNLFKRHLAQTYDLYEDLNLGHFKEIQIIKLQISNVCYNSILNKVIK